MGPWDWLWDWCKQYVMDCKIDPEITVYGIRNKINREYMQMINAGLDCLGEAVRLILRSMYMVLGKKTKENTCKWSVQGWIVWEKRSTNLSWLGPLVMLHIVARATLEGRHVPSNPICLSQKKTRERRKDVEVEVWIADLRGGRMYACKPGNTPMQWPWRWFREARVP
jgi:hypothetical protein